MALIQFESIHYNIPFETTYHIATVMVAEGCCHYNIPFETTYHIATVMVAEGCWNEYKFYFVTYNLELILIRVSSCFRYGERNVMILHFIIDRRKNSHIDTPCLQLIQIKNY